MNRENRIEQIKKITSNDELKFGKEEIVWEDSLQSMDVRKIPLQYLIYNKYNGRILTRTKSLEAQGKVIDAETDTGKLIIEKLLWESKPERNKTTKNDLEKYGQKRIGIVTADGIIIDGNRRAMLLNQIDKYDYFKAIVLPVRLDENPIEIEKLETSYQMGEDEKLGYNANEKYLKAKTLRERGVPIDTIANWMGESKSEIEKYLRTMEIMDDYLDFFSYNNMYTQLDGREDLFLSVEKWTNNFYGSNSAKAFDGYSDNDVDDLKAICYDYIRSDIDGKTFRNIAEGNQSSHVFGDQELWRDFSDKHFEFIQEIKDSESKIDLNVPDVEKSLKSRDNKFKVDSLDYLQENLDNQRSRLANKKYRDEPSKLVSKALDAIEIASSNKNLSNQETVDKIEKLNTITTNLLKQKSITKLLDHIYSLLDGLDFSGINDNDLDGIESKLISIQKLAYKYSKEI